MLLSSASHTKTNADEVAIESSLIDKPLSDVMGWTSTSRTRPNSRINGVRKQLDDARNQDS